MKQYKKYGFHRIIVGNKDKKSKFYFLYTSEKMGYYFVIKLNCIYLNVDIDTVKEKMKIFKEYVQTGRLVIQTTD